MNLKNSLASNVSAPVPEDEMMKKKVKNGSFVFIFITISDLIITLFTNIMNLIYLNKFKYDYLTIFIIFLLLYVCLFIIFLFINSQCICRLLFFYGLLLLIYFIIEISFQIKIMKDLSEMKDDYQKKNFDLIIFTFIILSLIIRIIILIVLYKYKNKLSNYEKFQRFVDHENFIERIENKVDKSSNIRWSDASKMNSYDISYDNKDSIDLQLITK
jgi:hypothetical protein